MFNETASSMLKTSDAVPKSALLQNTETEAKQNNSRLQRNYLFEASNPQKWRRRSCTNSFLANNSVQASQGLLISKE